MCRTPGRQEYARAKRRLHAYQQPISHYYALLKRCTGQPTLKSVCSPFANLVRTISCLLQLACQDGHVAWYATDPVVVLLDVNGQSAAKE